MTARRIAELAAQGAEIVADGLVPRHLHRWKLDGTDYEGYDHARCTFTWLIPPGPRGKRPRERVCNEYKDVQEIQTALDEREALLVISGPLSKEKWTAARKMVLLVVLLFASRLYAQSRPADQLYLPIAGHAVSGSTVFLSDLYVTNLSDDWVTVSITRTPANSTDDDPSHYDFAQWLPDRITLAPHEYLEVRDERLAALIPTGIGMLIFDACLVGADCSTRYDLVHGMRVEKVPNVRHRRPISVTARLYSYFGTPANWTRGEAYPSIAWYDVWTSDGAAVGMDRPFITGVRSDAHFRTNVTMANASSYSTIALRATLHDGTSGLTRGTFDKSLGPLESWQIGAEVMFPVLAESRLNRQPLVKNPWVSFEQIAVTPNALAEEQKGVVLGCADGCGAFLVQASVTDILSRDSWRLDAQSEKDGGLNGQSERSQGVEGKETQADGNAVLQRTVHPLSDASVQGPSLARTVALHPTARIADVLHFTFTGPVCSIEPGPLNSGYSVVRKPNGQEWQHVSVGELVKAREMCGAARTTEGDSK